MTTVMMMTQHNHEDADVDAEGAGAGAGAGEGEGGKSVLPLSLSTSKVLLSEEPLLSLSPPDRSPVSISDESSHEAESIDVTPTESSSRVFIVSKPQTQPNNELPILHSNTTEEVQGHKLVEKQKELRQTTSTSMSTSSPLKEPLPLTPSEAATWSQSIEDRLDRAIQMIDVNVAPRYRRRQRQSLTTTSSSSSSNSNAHSLSSSAHPPCSASMDKKNERLNVIRESSPQKQIGIEITGTQKNRRTSNTSDLKVTTKHLSKILPNGRVLLHHHRRRRHDELSKNLPTKITSEQQQNNNTTNRKRSQDLLLSLERSQPQQSIPEKKSRNNRNSNSNSNSRNGSIDEMNDLRTSATNVQNAKGWADRPIKKRCLAVSVSENMSKTLFPKLGRSDNTASSMHRKHNISLEYPTREASAGRETLAVDQTLSQSKTRTKSSQNQKISSATNTSLPLPEDKLNFNKDCDDKTVFEKTPDTMNTCQQALEETQLKTKECANPKELFLVPVKTNNPLQTTTPSLKKEDGINSMQSNKASNDSGESTSVTLASTPSPTKKKLSKKELALHKLLEDSIAMGNELGSRRQRQTPSWNVKDASNIDTVNTESNFKNSTMSSPTVKKKKVGRPKKAKTKAKSAKKKDSSTDSLFSKEKKSGLSKSSEKKKSTSIVKQASQQSTKQKTVGNVKRANPVVLWQGKPDEAFPGGGEWPEGWVKERHQRQGGATKGSFDNYWFTPQTKQKLRSMPDIRKWLVAMQQTNHVEEDANKIYRSIVLPSKAK